MDNGPTPTPTPKASGRLFADDTSQRGVVLPWGQTMQMGWSNVTRRLGRSIVSLVCIVVVVAFFSSSMTYQNILSDLAGSDDVHTQSVLEKAGVSTRDAAEAVKARDQRIWLIVLSSFLCFVGITNTILMSVTERFREIGTLKCLGALDRFIIRLFLLESAFIGLFGAFLGGLLGFVLGIIQLGAATEFSLLSLGNVSRALASGLPITMAGGAALTVLAAIYPTSVAAKMKPVDAMRTEI
jgi:putative ABC transport system permease protein